MTDQKIFIAGHKGLVGASILTYLKTRGAEIITRDRNELDLLNQSQVQDFFKSYLTEFSNRITFSCC